MNNIKHKRGTVGVYLILNLITGDSYIGSSKSIYYRIGRHKCDLIKDRSGNRNMQASWNEHGRGAFLVQVLELCKEEELLIREQHYIDTMKPIFNITKDVIHKSVAEESKILISNTLKKRCEEGMETYRQQHKWREVQQYDYKGNLLFEYSSAGNAAKSLGFERNTVLQGCKDYSLHRRGFQWKYKDSEKEILVFSFPLKDVSSNSKILKVVKDSDILFYPSMDSASISLGISTKSIRTCLQDPKKNKNNYYFYYYTAPVKSDELLETPVEDNQQPS